MTDVGMVSSNGDSDMSLRKRIFKKNQEFEGNFKENGDGGCQPTTEDQKIRIEKGKRVLRDCRTRNEHGVSVRWWRKRGNYPTLNQKPCYFFVWC